MRQAELLDNMRQMSRYYYGALGTFFYDAYTFINREYFGGDLPVPLLTVGITSYGACIGWTKANTERHPIIKLHPSTLAPANDGTWGGARHGLPVAYDVILHELTHVSVEYLVGRGAGDTSHNCDGWISEINRLSPLIGLDGIDAGRTVAQRVPVDGEFTKTGKPLTRVAKVARGNVSQRLLGRWPHDLRGDDYWDLPMPFDLSDSPEAIIREAVRARR